jgi:hypothetical protein
MATPRAIAFGIVIVGLAEHAQAQPSQPPADGVAHTSAFQSMQRAMLPSDRRPGTFGRWSPHTVARYGGVTARTPSYRRVG